MTYTVEPHIALKSVADIAAYWRRMEAFRKQPTKLIWNIGPLAFLKVALGLMSAVNRSFW